jgi:hypothetical protein
MAVQECRDGLGEQRRAGVRGIRNAWVRGSIPRGGSTRQPSNSGASSARHQTAWLIWGRYSKFVD